MKPVSPWGYGGHSEGETPGSIPNPEAKPFSADGTALGTVWESRTPPDKHSQKSPILPARMGLFCMPGSFSVPRGEGVSEASVSGGQTALARESPKRPCASVH